MNKVQASRGISDEVSYNHRRSIVSLASRSSYAEEDNAEEDFREISQLYRIRELGNRIAHERARTQGFCRFTQIKKIRVERLGAGEKAPVDKSLTPMASNAYVSEVGKEFSKLRVSDGWKGDDNELNQNRDMDLVHCLAVPLEQYDREAGSISIKKRNPSLQQNFWLGFRSESSVNDSISQKTTYKYPSGKWAIIAKRLSLNQLSRRSLSEKNKLRYRTFPLAQADAPDNIKREKQEGSKSNSITQERLPRLKPTGAIVLDNLDSSIVKDGTKKLTNLLNQTTEQPLLPLSTAKGAFLSVGTERRASSASKTIAIGQVNNVDRLPYGKNSSDNQQVRFSSESKRRQSLYQSRATTQLPNSKAVDESRFSTYRQWKRRLSDEFKRLESCRYLRLYKMK